MSRRDALGPSAAAEAAPPEARVIDEAAAWLVRLEEGVLQPVEAQRLRAWRAQSPEHERAWQAATELKRLMGAVPRDLGSTVLARRRMDRRTVLKSLAGALVIVPVGWMAYRQLPWDAWTADYRTAAGERRELVLADGSRLQLNTASAVDVAFDGDTRRLVLHEGEILVATAPDPAAIVRPFIVHTRHGHVRALGTTFSVRETADGQQAQTRVAVFEHAVAIRPALAEVETRLRAGRRASFTRTQTSPPEAIPEQALAWTRGRIVADNQRLGDFVEELARYRPGILRCDPAVADLRISGVFQTANTDQALSIVAETLPVRLTRLTGYWVSIGPRD